MGFKRRLFVDSNEEPFVCVKCDDVAIDPVTKSCCDLIVCKTCSSSYNCMNVSCRSKHDTSALPKPLPPRKSKEYFSLKLKCIDCATIVTISTLGTHYEGCLRKKYDEARASSDSFYYKRSALKSANEKLELKMKEVVAKNEEMQSAIAKLQNSAKVSKPKNNCYDGQEQDNGRTSVKRKSVESDYDDERPSTTTPIVRPPVTKPVSMPIVTIDPVKSESVPHGKIEELKRLIIAECPDGKWPDLRIFFKPIELGMKKKFNGDWRTWSAKLFDPEKARCQRNREIHYSIQWIDSVRPTYHVTYDHPSRDH